MDLCGAALHPESGYLSNLEIMEKVKECHTLVAVAKTQGTDGPLRQHLPDWGSSRRNRFHPLGEYSSLQILESIAADGGRPSKRVFSQTRKPISKLVAIWTGLCLSEGGN